MTRLSLILGAALLALAAWPAAGAAHVDTTGYSEIRQEGADVRYRLGLEYDPLVEAAGLGADARSGSSDQLAAALDGGRGRLASYLAPRLRVSVDGAACRPPAVRETSLDERSGTTYAQLLLAFRCPVVEDGVYSVRYEVFSIADDVRSRHANIADFELGDASGQFVFDRDHTLLVAEQSGLLSSAGRFVEMGVEHILLGLDHVLFLLVLLLGARSLRSVVEMATAFTVAHSITLALASLGWVDIPADVVEPLIALSIAYVAVETILDGDPRRRLAVVFGFGLLHGLGFAGTVDFAEEAPGRLLSSLLSFNVGIELGQALIVAAVFPLLLLVRRFGWSDLAHAAGASAAAAVGLFWFSERLPL
jgi:hypothetical protein